MNGPGTVPQFGRSDEASNDISLSQEIIDLIIDEVANDRVALRACSLMEGSYVGAIDPSWYSNPSVAHHVRKLSLSLLPNIPVNPPPIFSNDPSEGSLHHSGQIPRNRSDCLLLWSIISRFRSLDQLIVTFYDFTKATEEDMARWSTHFPTVQKLSLHLTRFQNTSDFLSILTCFPSLRNLSINDIQWPDSPEPEPTSSQLENQWSSWKGIRSLSFLFGGCDPHVVEGIANWLSKIPEHDKLSSRLDIEWENNEGGALALPKFLNCVGSSLKRLRIRLAAPDGRRLLQEGNAIMTRNTFLEVLHFERLTFNGRKRGKAKEVYDWIPFLLRQVASNSVHTIIFSCEPVIPPDMLLIDWRRIDHILSLPPFLGSLRRLVIGMNCGLFPIATCDPRVMDGMLVRSLERGIVDLRQHM